VLRIQHHHAQAQVRRNEGYTKGDLLALDGQPDRTPDILVLRASV
jgi:hypothetical protein